MPTSNTYRGIMATGARNIHWVVERLRTGKPLIMGILNVTPDSFSDGGEFLDTSQAIEHGLDMVQAGADIIDIGGESSRPGSDPVPLDEELQRVLPVVEKLTAKTSASISIDTTKMEVARDAIAAGASIVNDISALRADPRMAPLIARTGAAVVLMHMQGTPRSMQANPRYSEVVTDIISFLNERIQYTVSQGINNDSIIIDPGIGFGKTLEHNLEILRRIDEFVAVGHPVLVGASRKRMISAITGAAADDRICGTAAIVAHCTMRGVAIHRVHDVHEMRQAADVAAAIRGITWN